MRRALLVLLGILVGVGLGLDVALRTLVAPAKRIPDTPSVVTQLRDVARITTLDVSLYKKVSFEPDPPAPGDSTLGNVVSWARYNLRQPHGRAILFGTVHLELDLAKLDADHVRVVGDEVSVILPPVTEQVELDPGATEIIDSNLDSAETAKLLDAGKLGLAADAHADARLRERARASAERALRALVLSLGFRALHVVTALPPTA